VSNEPKTARELAAELEAAAEQAKLMARIEAAVARYGRSLSYNTPIVEAYTTLSECLEEGADALEKQKQDGPAT
jgi:hypothetical protein